MMSTPEAVKQYLADKNINSLLKWITTELVVHKPEDPCAFIHNLTKLLLRQNGYEYSIENIEEMIVNARKKSELEVEKEAKILNEPAISIKSNSEQKLNQDFSKIVDSMREIATELNPKKAAKMIAQQTCSLLQCEKAIFYSFDAENETINVNSEDSLKEMKFPVNKGIIGRCIKNCKFEIIENVYDDKDFDDTIDKILNIKTKNLLCCPLKDFETQEVYGIIEAINKQNDNKFSDHDVDLLKALGTIGQITIQNGIIYEMAATERYKNEAMLALWSHLNDESKVFNINSLLFTITRRCLEIVDAEKCTFYFVDHENKELWSLHGEINIRMPINKGMAGLCATSEEIVNEENVYNNNNFDKINDEKTGFVTKSMLCVPMKSSSDNKVIGVIQLINKKGMIDVFDQNDEQILELVLSAASPIVEQNQLFFVNENKDISSPKKDEKFVTDLHIGQKRSSSMSHHDIGALVEEEQSNDEEEETEIQTNEQNKI